MEGGASARRRRIMERGSDRLAFITGESNSLPVPPSPPPLPPKKLVADFSQGDATVENDNGKEHDEDEATEEFPKCKLGKEFPKRGRSSEPPPIDADPVEGGPEPSNTSTARAPSNHAADTAPSTAPQMSRPIFTPNQISRSIAATENTRILCAIAIALLVVLSNRGYSLGGSILNGLVSFRPLFLVLLSDVAIVLGRALVMEGSSGRTTRQEEKSMEDNVGKALEAGMVLQRGLRSAFMDCSICAVILISGVVVKG